MKYIIHFLYLSFGLLFITSCASKKSMTKEPAKGEISKQSTQTPAEEMSKHLFVKKVIDNGVYAPNIVGKISFQLTRGSQRISAPGSLKMRKDKVIRLQLFIPFLGSEVGRIEFTPDGVLVIDRIHKEYVKATYDDVAFLRNNGLIFYSLQALFWNQLMIPGEKQVKASDLENFRVNLTQAGDFYPITLVKGAMTYLWNANKNNGRIATAVINYVNSQQEKSVLTWNYQNFKSIGLQYFPSTQSFTFTTHQGAKARQHGEVTIAMDEIKTDADWEERSTVSNRYQRVDAEDIIGKLLYSK